jgi:hypothetical protein
MIANPRTAQTLEQLFQALQVRDLEALSACYAEGAQFDDPLLSLKDRRHLLGMRAVMFEARGARGQDVWALSFHGMSTAGNQGSARWEPRYCFAPTGRSIHHLVYSQFTFDPDGLIVAQRDSFDFWRWSRAAHGVLGLMLGWTPLMWDQARAQVEVCLGEYLADHAQAQPA